MKSVVLWLLLGLVGAVLVVMSSYIQVSSMDLSRFRLPDYFAADIAMREWWSAIALPFIVGVVYLCVAGACIRACPTGLRAVGILIGCMVVAGLLFLVNPGWAFYSLIQISILLVVAVLRWARPENASSRGAA